jgi:hypothetical protein
MVMSESDCMANGRSRPCGDFAVGAVLHGQHADISNRLADEVELLTRGVVGGAINEAEKDPLGTVGKAAAAVGVGAVLGIAATAASPIVAAGAAGIGILGTGAWLWGTLNTLDHHNVERNEALMRAVTETWNGSDRSSFENRVGIVQQAVGKDALDLGLGLLSGVGAGAGARFAPGFVCRQMPSVGFKFFSQHAIESAFPAQAREFRFEPNEQVLSSLRSGQPTLLPVEECIATKNGAFKLGPSRTLLVAHNGAQGVESFAPSHCADLLATCHPENLPPALRAKSILQYSTDVELQLDAAVSKLRFLTADRLQSSNISDTIGLERFTLGGQHSEPLSASDFLKMLRLDPKSRDIVPEEFRDLLSDHDLHEIEIAFRDLPYKVDGILGVGAESIAFRLSPMQDAPIFAEERIDPSNVVLKFSKPVHGHVKEYHGTRVFDAQRFGEFETRPFRDYIGYLQEKVDPVSTHDVDESELDSLLRQITREFCHFYDFEGNKKQLGYTSDGELKVLDWFSVVPMDEVPYEASFQHQVDQWRE